MFTYNWTKAKWIMNQKSLDMKVFLPSVKHLKILNFVQKQPPNCSVWKSGLRNFVKFTVKHLCQSLHFNKVAGLRPATLSRKRPWHRFFSCEFCEISKNTSGRLLLVVVRCCVSTFEWIVQKLQLATIYCNYLVQVFSLGNQLIFKHYWLFWNKAISSSWGVFRNLLSISNEAFCKNR